MRSVHRLMSEFIKCIDIITQTLYQEVYTLINLEPLKRSRLTSLILNLFFHHQRLIQCKREVCENLSLDPDSLELSMGMSGDFEHAVRNILYLDLYYFVHTNIYRPHPKGGGWGYLPWPGRGGGDTTHIYVRI